jgi:hypothetical protein
VRWVSLGLRCVQDGTLAVYADWKIDYSPTGHLLSRTHLTLHLTLALTEIGASDWPGTQLHSDASALLADLADRHL